MLAALLAILFTCLHLTFFFLFVSLFLIRPSMLQPVTNSFSSAHSFIDSLRDSRTRSRHPHRHRSSSASSSSSVRLAEQEEEVSDAASSASDNSAPDMSTTVPTPTQPTSSPRIKVVKNAKAKRNAVAAYGAVLKKCTPRSPYTISLSRFLIPR